MSCLRYLYLFVCNGVQHMLCCIFVLFDFVLCVVPNVDYIPGLSILDCPFGFLERSFTHNILFLYGYINSKD